jgi:phosphoglycerate kinase
MDFNHDPHSSIFHTDQTKVMDGNMCSILTWYDNEWGFSNRMADTAVAMGKTDATRIERIVPTVKDILAKGGKPVLLAHFGRPKGQPVPEMSLRHVVPALEDALGQPVTFVERPDRAVWRRFPRAAWCWSRTPASPRWRPRTTRRWRSSSPPRGRLLQRRLLRRAPGPCLDRGGGASPAVLRRAPDAGGTDGAGEGAGHPERPVVAVVGGAKVSTKLDLLGNLTQKVDMLVIGGGMANTFLAAQGIDVAASLCEHDLGDTARDILARAEAAGCEVILPTDVVVAKEFAANARTASFR